MTYQINVLVFALKLLVCLSFLNCTNKNNTPKNTKIQTVVVDNPIKIASDKNKDSILDDENLMNMKNPILIYGSTFGHYFQAYYKIGNFDYLMRLTSDSSIKRFGYKNILKAYKKMDFAYSLKFKSLTTENKSWVIHYETTQFATKKMLIMHVTLEHDTVRLIINNLSTVF